MIAVLAVVRQTPVVFAKRGKFEGMEAENEEIKNSKFAKPMRPHKLLSNA